MKKRLVYLCDWLPPDFGAVGQYAMLFARNLASDGWAVTLVGLTSGRSSKEEQEPVGSGTLAVVRVHRPKYRKESFYSRAAWTLVSNFLLLKAGFKAMRQADTVLFTGSPPLLLHFVAPLNLILRKHLVYRITDFYPECLLAERGRRSFVLNILLRFTLYWRRRIDTFEVLGLDQARRLKDMGIAEERICLKRNPSPVVFTPDVVPLPWPKGLCAGLGIILYSGNWGVAHDEGTFTEAYTRYQLEAKHGLVFWLNASGAKADRVENLLRSRRIPVYRSHPMTLDTLPRLLCTADVHLITLRDPFVGYVLPSKVHACIASGKRILFVGSERSDVHLLASHALSSSMYWRVDVGDVAGLVKALSAIEQAIMAQRQRESVIKIGHPLCAG